MKDDHADAMGRRVISGVDADGKSIIVRDENTNTRVRRPDGTIVMDIWRLDNLPTHVDEDGTLVDEVLSPPAEGLVVRLSMVPPNSDMDATAYARALTEIYGPQPDPADTSGIPGLHRTETVDAVTVVAGEIYAVLETGETLLRPGDTFIQRGTMHAWHNRSDSPATLISIMMSAKR